MNRSENSSKDDGHSSGNKATPEVTSSEELAADTTTSTESKTGPVVNLNIEDGMKRAAVKERIEKYFYQLTNGCGNDGCTNENCASSGKFNSLSPNEAAGMALKLWKSHAKLCDPHPAKIQRTNNKSELENNTGSSENKIKQPSSSTSSASSSTATTTTTPPPPPPPPETSIPTTDTISSNEIKNLINDTKSCETSNSNNTISNCIIQSNNKIDEKPPQKTILTERKLCSIIEECKVTNNYTRLRSILFEVFSTQEFLSESFKRAKTLEELHDSIPDIVIQKMSKEKLASYSQPKSTETILPDLSTIESSTSPNTINPTDQCSTEETVTNTSVSASNIDIDPNNDHTDVDIESIRRTYEQLFSLPSSEFEGTLVQALVSLSEWINLQLRYNSNLIKNKLESFINIFLIIFEIPSLGGCDYVERALPKICIAAIQLPLTAQARIAKIWAKHCKQRLKTILEALQQLITIKTISGHYNKDYIVQDEETITAPTIVMRILFYANILAGDLEPTSLRDEIPEVEDINHESIFGVAIPSSKSTQRTTQYEDLLGVLLKVNVLDCRKPYIPFLEFYNEPLSDAIEMDRDFGYYRAYGQNTPEPSSSDSVTFGLKFSFMYYSFILTPATKTLGLYFDSRIRMYSERRISYLQSVVGQPTNPYLRLKVRRDHIIEDALVELEMIAMENEKDLKKQLVVEFEGEQGIDEGGVSKEFFQLVVEEIFNPDYGMFSLIEETQHMWFNQMSFESDAQFTLIGIVIGLAIYNNIILDVNFPMVVYKKLMGKRGSFYDLEDFSPILFNSLKSLIDFQQEDGDMIEIFNQTFQISYTDPFGNVLTHNLKENGDTLFVNHENKYEFVNLYSDFLLNKSIEKQFKEFKRGFQMVTDESPLNLLFRPEEIEQLVCGSKIFDLSELEEATEYDAGYSADTPVIKYFWEIIHAMPQEQQKKLLQFTTGSDRIPVGGLSKLKMFIARIGPDSDRLPTAHTCFNVLLLPEYSSKEKLYERLMKAITYSKGFGML